MIKKTCSVLSGLLIMALSSCSDDNPWLESESGQGAITLTLNADGDIISSRQNTKAEGSDYIEVPETSEFRILLEKEDGSYSKDFSYDEFVNYNGGFSTGNYVITAYCGDVNDEGFEKVAFKGSENVLVLEDREQKVNIHAKVAHTLVSIKYTEAFQNYMSNYSTIVHSDGHTDVLMEAAEERPAFIVPGEISLTLSFTNPQGQSLTIQPAGFTGEAAHHYLVTLDVNGGETGDATLKIEFDDLLEEEDVEIDLTQELFTSKAPEITPGGFENEGLLEFLAYEAPEAEYRYDIIANGGLSELKLRLLTLEGDFTPAFGSEVELLSATTAQIQQLENFGFKFWGLKNADKMAVVDFSKLGNNLPAGKYELSLVAVDKLTRSTEPVTVIINSVAASVKTTPQTSLYGTNQGNLIVSYNGNNPEKAITFMAKNQNGIFVAAPVTSCVAVNTRAIEPKDYNFTIKLADMEQDPLEIKVYLNGQYAETVVLPVEIPQFSADADAYAKKVVIRINSGDDQKSLITDNVKIYDGNTRVPESRISRNGDSGLITVTGLNPKTDYTYSVSLRSATVDNQDLKFTTEDITNLTNGDFENVSRTINIETINAGGSYDFAVGIFKMEYQNRTSIKIDTPDDWSNMNPITCNENSSLKNTWYMVPSTLIDETGKVKIRSVGYNEEGTAITKGDASALRYYSPVPVNDNQLKRSAGKLFYGSDEAKGSSFTSRPETLTFNYKYLQKNGESAGATVKVYNGDTVIGYGQLSISNESGTGKVNIYYDKNAFGKRATSLSIVFISSNATTPYIYIPSGDELNDNPSGVPNAVQRGATLDANSYKSYASGSELTIDNVKVNY